MATKPDKDEPAIIPVEEGAEHGYIGQVQPDKDRDAYTVTGVTGGTAKASDAPKSASTKSTPPKTSNS